MSEWPKVKEVLTEVGAWVTDESLPPRSYTTCDIDDIIRMHGERGVYFDLKIAEHVWEVYIKNGSVGLSRSGRRVFHSSEIDELSLTIYSGVKFDRESLAMVEEAIGRYNRLMDRDERITHPDAPASILRAACCESSLKDYIVDTGNGIEDCNVEDGDYLDWVIENVPGGWC